MTDDDWPYDSECPECGRWNDIAAAPDVIGPDGPREATLICQNCLHEWTWTRND